MRRVCTNRTRAGGVTAQCIMSLWASLVLLLLLVAIGKVGCDLTCGDVKSATTDSARRKLHQTIREQAKCDYTREMQPQRTMNITVELLVHRAKVAHNTLEMKALVVLRWKDSLLTWDPARYDDVKQIRISSHDIWTPEVAAISTLPWLREEIGAPQAEFWPSLCRLTSDGAVACTGAMDLGGACYVSHLYWPHVEANCGAFFGADYRVGKDVYFDFYNSSIETELRNYVPDNNWVVTKAKRVQQPEGPSEVLMYIFKLHSRGALISTGLIGPAVVLSILLLGSFVLPPTSTTRIGLCCCSTFGSVLVSSIFIETLPPHDGPSPVILVFYSGLLVLSSLAIGMTLLLNIVVPEDGKSPGVPRWLFSAHLWLTTSPIGQVILKVLFMTPRDQTDDVPAQVCYEDEVNQDEAVPRNQQTSDVQTRNYNQRKAPHRIWDFTGSFLNRVMLFIFQLACTTLCLCLLKFTTMYNDYSFTVDYF